MNFTFWPIWCVDVGGSILMILFSIGALLTAQQLRRKEPANIVWTYLLWVCYALMVFAVSRSVGHIVRQTLILSDRRETWEAIRPYSGAVNTFSFMVVGSVTLFFERTWTIYQGILQDRQKLADTHQELIYLNQNLERLVRERTRALALSEHQYRRIFETSHDMILVTRRDGQILDINPAGKAMLGLEDNAAEPGRFADFFQKPGEWTGLMDRLQARGFVAGAEFHLKTAMGGSRHVLLSGGPAEGLSGENNTFHFLAMDVEQQYMMREQMAQADKLASIGELSAGIAHEINNPLGIILGYTQLMLRSSGQESELTADLKTIEKQVRHCKTIVEDLLNFARTSPPQKAMCDIHKIIDEVLHFIRQHAKVEAIAITTAYDRHIGPLFMDEKSISQVLINLLMNAIYALDGRGAITVSTHALNGGRKSAIKVQDTGQGIAAGDLPRIFDPFFTTKPTGQGTGLGLSVSYGIIKNHGGEIRVESRPGQGTTFTIELPTPSHKDEE